METKFILHGGFAKGSEQANDSFFSEVLKSAPKETKILLVYFAKEPDSIEKSKEEDLKQFNRNKGNRNLSFIVANTNSFPDQIRSSNVVYLHGGHSGKLLDTLKDYSNLKELLDGKIVAGDSAGANVLTSAFYSQKIGVSEGLGLIPIKIISHYLEENKHRLDHIKPELETLFLSEYEFKVLVL